jgi:hypothetical protein
VALAGLGEASSSRWVQLAEQQQQRQRRQQQRQYMFGKWSLSGPGGGFQFQVIPVE